MAIATLNASAAENVRYFWCAFIAASVLGQMNVPFVSKFVRDTAKRGKTRDASKTKRRRTLYELLNVPHAWFTHFYVVGTVWNAHVLLKRVQSKRDIVDVSSFATAVMEDSSGELLASVLFQFHVTRRLMESLFVKVNKKKAKMHAIGYVLGLLYYVCATLSLKNSRAGRTTAGERKVEFLFASLLFFCANWKQYECHVLLRNARLQTDRKDQYAQIDSGLFSLVACPHYFFECVLYFSLCVALRFSPSSVLMFLAVCGNLSVEAKNHLIWYRNRIKGFPRRRKAMVPYVF